MSVEYKKMYIITDYSKVNISKEYINIEQFYLSFNPKIRCRNFNGHCTFNIKVPIKATMKIEHSFEISLEEYEELKKHRASKVLCKHRHDIKFDDCICIYDEYYEGINLNIICMEFFSKEEMDMYKPPEYLKETGDMYTEDELKV